MPKSVDIYSYEGESVLKNKMNCHNASNLHNIEAEITGARLLELQQQPINGKFDFAHLRAIHKHIFQDIYNWAGQPRTIDIGKGNLFCRAQFINDYAEDVFRSFAKDCYAVRHDKEQFVTNLSEHYGDMNALHPFREGNGRTQREFTRELCLKCGYVLDFSNTTHTDMLSASVKSFNTGDNSEFKTIFTKCLHQTDDYPNLETNLSQKIMILSSSDHSEYDKIINRKSIENEGITQNIEPENNTDYYLS